jgi:S1-C subfamily serine protease
MSILGARAQAQSARDVAKRVTPSVVLLVMQDENGQPLSMGSGFVVREGVIVTNLHVVSGAARGYAKLPGQKDKLPIDGTVGIDGTHDLAVLSVPTAKAPQLPLGKSSDAAAGDEVYAIGNPQGLEGTFSAGIISGVRKIGTDTIIQITAPISPGSSGGPVTNMKGEVIGVSVATFKGGQNLNFAIPSTCVESLLAKPTPVTALAKAMKAQSAKAQSILDGLGGKSTAGVEGASFTWDNSFGRYSFSFKNKLQADVRDVVCLVVFYDDAGSAIDVDLVQFAGVLPAGLAKRVTSSVDDSVLRLNTENQRGENQRGRESLITSPF